MTPFAQVLCLGGVYFVAVVAVLELGYRVGASARQQNPAAVEGTGAVEAVVLGLVGLILAFAFGSAQQRLENRRALIVREANAIGTAYLRLDLLPAEDQPPLRDLFRRYTDVRIRTFRDASDRAALARGLDEGARLQREIWDRALVSAKASGATPGLMLLTPALNDMIDVTTDRTVAVETHLPALVAGLLACLGLCAALLSGYAMAKRPRPSPLHVVVFALAVGGTVFVVLDLEQPRAGLIRVGAADHAMTDLKDLMRK